MSSTFGGLEISKRGLAAQQAALQTTGHNVANANTEGYSRQSANLQTTSPIHAPSLVRSMQAGQIGTGVTVESITRAREGFLDKQYRNENQSLGEWNVKQQTLDKIQVVINEPSNSGLSTVVTQFFNAWHDLSVTPESITARKVVKQRGIELVESVQHMSNQLQTLDSDLKDAIGVKVNDVNSTLGQIRELNRQIRVIETSGDTANDLRDRRDVLVDRLSKLADVRVSETPSAYSIAIGGQTVLQGDAAPTQLTFDPATGAINPPVTGGELKGLQDSRVTYVKSYQDQLNAFVNGLVQGKMQSTLPNPYVFDSTATTMPFDATLPDGTVLKKGDPIPTDPSTGDKRIPTGSRITVDGLNGLHMLGYTQESPTNAAPPFFTTNDGSTIFTASNIKVNDALMSDERLIATSDSTYTDASGNKQSVKGNGDIALMIGEMTNNVIDYSGAGLKPVVTRGTVEDYFQALVGQLGVQSQEATRMNDNQDSLVRQIDNQRQSVSGVSVDEEMANMIKYQQAYNANARMITVIDSLLDRVINGMGLTR